ncbi:MAG: ankyrin repeat domain-containing protein [Synergistaceae bacterium]|nr:ankyrin repeat domain-containing protein [Synergistaceae bacterium]MBQ3346853.1 ankyrin repeat domain-containing protein [Synergistaceae bacterium]
MNIFDKLDLDSLTDEELSAVEEKYYSFLDGICGEEAVNDYCEFHSDWDFCREIVRYIEGGSNLTEEELRVMIYAYVEDNDRLSELLDSNDKININIDFMPLEGPVALVSALDSGNIEGMEILLKHGASPDIFSSEDESLLLGMVRKQAQGSFVSYYRAIDLLLSHGADPYIPNKQEKVCADFARKDPKLVEIFAKHGIDFLGTQEDVCFITKEGVNVYNVYDDCGRTLLMSYVINAVDERRHPFNDDYWCGIRRLVEKAGVNVNAVSDDDEEMTALMYTFGDDDKFSPEIASYLLEHGADPNIPNAEGMRFIDALCFGHFDEAKLEILKLAVRHGADIKSCGYGGMTPLMHCVVGARRREDDRNFEAIKFLVEFGADVNARRNNENGFTALIYAAYSRCEYAGDIIEYLVENGADTQITIKNGWKAVNFLKIRSNPSKERVRALLQ